MWKVSELRNVAQMLQSRRRGEYKAISKQVAQVYSWYYVGLLVLAMESLRCDRHDM